MAEVLGYSADKITELRAVGAFGKPKEWN